MFDDSAPDLEVGYDLQGVDILCGCPACALHQVADLLNKREEGFGRSHDFWFFWFLCHSLLLIPFAKPVTPCDFSDLQRIRPSNGSMGMRIPLSGLIRAGVLFLLVCDAVSLLKGSGVVGKNTICSTSIPQ